MLIPPGMRNETQVELERPQLLFIGGVIGNDIVVSERKYWTKAEMRGAGRVAKSLIRDALKTPTPPVILLQFKGKYKSVTLTSPKKIVLVIITSHCMERGFLTHENSPRSGDR